MRKLKNKTFILIFPVLLLLGLVFSVVAPRQSILAAAVPSVVMGQAGGTSSNFSGKCENPKADKTNCGIIAYLVDFIRVLSGLVGIVVVIMIVVGGIQYSSARDNPQATAAAKTRITNAILALIFYMFIFAFLQWLVPGGIL